MRASRLPPTGDSNDAALLAEAAAGAEDAFVELYRRRRDDVYRFAYALTRSRSCAQDATQEVFLNVLENARGYDPAKGSVRAWLVGCARHVAIDRLRSERRWVDEAPEPATACDAEQRVLKDQRLARLHEAIARLPFQYREALVLCELAELSYAETAAVLDCPLGTVRSRLHRARSLLATALRDAEAGRGDEAAFKATEACP